VAAHEKAIELSPKDHLVWANLGDALAFTEREHEARAAFHKAEELVEVSLTVNPINVGTLIDLAWIKAMLGKVDDARRSIARAREIAPSDPYVHFVAALISVRLGETAAAYDELQAAIATGYSPKLIAAEPHLKALWNEPHFVALTKEKSAVDKQNR
jgi:Flp pilus assembly protein TadD